LDIAEGGSRQDLVRRQAQEVSSGGSDWQVEDNHTTSGKQNDARSGEMFRIKREAMQRTLHPQDVAILHNFSVEGETAAAANVTWTVLLFRNESRDT
jgi:hypothetical protein